MVCDCKACELGLFQPLRMPILAYQELHNMLFPLPIPQASPRDDSGILHYMSLEENLAMPFTDDHQPSRMSKVAATSAKNSQAIPAPATNRGRGRGIRGRGRGRGRVVPPPVRFLSFYSITQTVKRIGFAIGHLSHLRGVVHCKDCTKPRCIYSM